MMMYESPKSDIRAHEQLIEEQKQKLRYITDEKKRKKIRQEIEWRKKEIYQLEMIIEEKESEKAS